MTFKAMRFVVKNSKESEKVQAALFRLGYQWSFNGELCTNFMYTGKPVIYAEIDGSLCHGTEVDATHGVENYVVKEKIEYTIFREKDIVQFEGKTYDRLSFENALRGVTPL